MCGAELSLLDLTKYAKSKGFRIFVFGQNRGDLHSEYEEISESITYLKFMYPRKLNNIFRYNEWKNKFYQFVENLGGNTWVWVGDMHYLFSVTRFKFKKNVKIVGQWRGEYVFGEEDANKWVRYGANKADALITSPFVAQDLNSQKKLNKNVCSLTPSLDLGKFNPDLYEKKALKKEYGFASKVILMIGRVCDKKGQFWFCEEWIKKNLGKLADLVVAGYADPEDLNRMRDLTKKDSTIKYLGVRSDIPELIAASDIMVFPGTFRENYPRVLMEALVMKIPFVTYDVGVTGMILGNCPFLTKSGDKEKFIEILNSFLESEDHFFNWGKEFSASSFSRENWMRDLDQYFSEEFLF